MKLSIFKIILLSAILVVLVSISSGLFVNAQTDTDKGPAGQNPGSSSSQPAPSSSAPSTTDGEPSTSSALDPNAPEAAQPASTANDLDFVAARPAGVSASSLMWFKFVGGTAFHARNDTYTQAESSDGGCIYQTTGTTNSMFVADLQLPDAAVVGILRLFYYDTSGSNSSAWITQYDGAGGYKDIAYIPSTDSTGYGSNANSGFSYTVSNYDHPIVLNWQSNQLGDTIRLCGMRIRYFTNGPFFLPYIMKH